MINSEKMMNQLNQRKNNLLNQLNILKNNLSLKLRKKGQISESLRAADKENKENQILIEELKNKINSLRSELNEVQEK